MAIGTRERTTVPPAINAAAQHKHFRILVGTRHGVPVCISMSNGLRMHATNARLCTAAVTNMAQFSLCPQLDHVSKSYCEGCSALWPKGLQRYTPTRTHSLSFLSPSLRALLSLFALLSLSSSTQPREVAITKALSVSVSLGFRKGEG